jgi:hypothetical protein
MRSLTLILLSLPLAGCTAARAAYMVHDAQKRYAEALAEGALERAPYETELARAYLEKAKEEINESDYGASERLARKAAEVATVAYDKVTDMGRPEIKGNTEEFVPEVKPEEAPEQKAGDGLDINLDEL